MGLPCLKNARRIFAIVSTTSIPTSASKNHGSQCGPSVPGSRLEADHPEKGSFLHADSQTNRLNREHRSNGDTRGAELAKVEKHIWGIIEAIKAGMFHGA